MSALLGYAAIQAAAAGGKWAYNKYFNKKPGFDKTSYGERLKRLSEQGSISPLAKDNILAKTSKVVGQQTSNQVAGYQGRLANMGILDSVAGVRGQTDIESRGTQILADKATDIETTNELAKEKYKTQYAYEKGGYEEGIRQMNAQNNANLVSGLIDAGGSYAAGKLAQPDMKDLNIDDPGSWSTWLSKQSNTEQGLNTLRQLSMSKYYAQRAQGGNAEPTTVMNAYETYKNDNDRDAFFMRLIGLGLSEERMLWIASVVESGDKQAIVEIDKNLFPVSGGIRGGFRGGEIKPF